MKYLMIVLMFTFVTPGLVESFAQPGRNFSKEKRFERIAEKLNLSNEQKEKISVLREDHQLKMVDLKADVEKAKIEFRSLRDKGDFSRNDYLSAVEKMNSLKNKMAIEKANHQMDIYEILNTEQRQLWNEHRFEMGKRNDRKFGRHYDGFRHRNRGW